MPRKRKRSELEEATVRQSSVDYKSKLRQLDSRQSNKSKMSSIAGKSVPLESKKLSLKIFKPPARKVRRKKNRQFVMDLKRILRRRESKDVQTTAINSNEVIMQLCEVANQNRCVLDSFRDEELEAKHEDQIMPMDIDLSSKENSATSETEIVFRNSTLECNEENKSSANDVPSARCETDSVNLKFMQDDSIKSSPEYSPIRHAEAEALLETISATFDLSNSSSESNPFSKEVVDKVTKIPTEKHGATSNDLGIPLVNSSEDVSHAQLHQGEKADEGALKMDTIQRYREFVQIENNALANFNSSKKTTVKQTLLFARKNHHLLKEKYKFADLLYSPYPTKKCKIKFKNFLDQYKGCLRYAIPLEDIFNKNGYGFILPILKPIQNHQLPAEFTLHVEKYSFIQNCPVVKCLSYLHRFPNFSSTNVWSFLCPTPSKIRLPNFIFISTGSIPLPVLYNKKLYTCFENFMNIYSELKVGYNFILLNLLTDNESPVSTAYPLRFPTEHDKVVYTSLFNKLGLKINKARPIVIMETDSIENSDFDHPCLVKKFENFKFVSLNIMPDVVLENLEEVSLKRQVSVSFPFIVQNDFCCCMFADRKIAVSCPMRTFLLALTNNVQFSQSITQSNRTVRPLEGSICVPQKRKLSPKLDVQKISKQLKSKEGKKIARNRIKVKRLKKQAKKINVKKIIVLRTDKIIKRSQTIETNMPKIKSSKTEKKISCNTNILPVNLIKNASVASPHQLECLDDKEILSIDGNKVPSAAPRMVSQSKSPETVVMSQLPGTKDLFTLECILPSFKPKNIEHPLVSNYEIKIHKHSSASEAGGKVKSPNLLATMLQHSSQNKSVLSTAVDENRPLCLVKKSNTYHSFRQVASENSAEMAISNYTNSNALTTTTNDILKSPEDLSRRSENLAIPSTSNLVQNVSFPANYIETSMKELSTPTTSQQIGQNVTIEHKNSKSCPHSKTLSNSPTNSGKLSEATLQPRAPQIGLVADLLGFMEVHFFSLSKDRNPSFRLSVWIPTPININVLSADEHQIKPNAILLQSAGIEQKLVKTKIHVRKIITIEEIESLINDPKMASPSISGSDKQMFMFQLSPCQKMQPQNELENLRRLDYPFLPRGMYLLTPVRKNGACEIEIYKKLKNNELSELKRVIGLRYNLGNESVEIADLIEIPDYLFFASNVQLTDIL